MLGVASDAPPEQIKKAYRRLARELHPDVNPDPEAQERFKAVSAAYEVLSDPDKRRVVDLGGDPLQSGGGPAAGGFAAGFGGLQDIVDAFFGGGGGRARGPRSRVRQGADALLRLELDLHECAFGVEKEVVVDTAVVCDTCTGAGTQPGTEPEICDTCGGRGEVSSVQRSLLGQVVTSRPCPTCAATGQVLPHPCRECGGDGRVRARRTLTVKVPAGVANGLRIRLAGQGEVGPGGGPAGDLYVEVAELPDERLERDGDDLHVQLSVPMTAAALGARMPVPTLEGDEDFDVAPGTQPGAVLPLRARGVPHLRRTGRGDLLIHVDVEVPTGLDDEQEKLLRRLAELRGEEKPGSEQQAGHHEGLFGRFRRHR